MQDINARFYTNYFLNILFRMLYKSLYVYFSEHSKKAASPSSTFQLGSNRRGKVKITLLTLVIILVDLCSLIFFTIWKIFTAFSMFICSIEFDSAIKIPVRPIPALKRRDHKCSFKEPFWQNLHHRCFGAIFKKFFKILSLENLRLTTSVKKDHFNPFATVADII